MADTMFYTLLIPISFLLGATFTLAADTYLLVSRLPADNKKASLLFYPNYIDTITSGTGQNSELPFQSKTYITRMSSFPAKNSLFFFDMYTKYIYRMTGVKELKLQLSSKHYGISSSHASSIAFDWVRGNIYWTDGLFGWVALQPSLTDDPTMFAIIHQDNVHQPRAIAVDPITGYIFWFDTMKNTPRIEISQLSGDKRRVLISTGLKSVHGLVADHANKKLYWTDEYRFSIEEASYDGTDRRIVYRENNVPFSSLALSKDYLCFGYLKGFGCMSKVTGIIRYLEQFGQYVAAVDVFDESLQPSKNDECGTKCDHICTNDADGPKCLCKEGFKLDQNGTTCKPQYILEGKGLFIVNDTHSCIVGIQSLTGMEKPLNCILDDIQKTVHITMDSVNYIMYYGESNTARIKSYNFITKKSEIVAETRNTGKLSGLAYDWIAGLLYWTESDSGKVKYVDITTKSVATLVTTIQPAYHVTLDPYNKIVFWVSGVPNFPNSIESIVNDGKSVRKTVIGKADVKSVTGLFFDQRSKRLYWINDGSLYSASTNGTSVKKHVNVGTGLNTMLLIYKEYVIWSHDNSPIKASDMTTPSAVTLNQISSVNGIAIYDPTTQKSQPGPCDVMNGNCEHICIPQTNTTRICKCDTGFYLHDDGQSCDSNVMTDNFILTQDLIHGRLHQFSLDATKFVSLDIPIVDRPGDIIYNEQLKRIFWTETNKREILSATLQGTDVTSLMKFENEYPDRIAIDFATNLVYYTTTSLDDNGKGTVGVLHPTEKIKRTLVAQNDIYKFVTGICLHSQNGLVFWASLSNDNKALIARASMDGSLVRILVSTGLDKPRGLAIDYTSSRLYWTTNAGIYSSDFEGNSIQTLIEEKQELSDLVIMSPYIYYVGRRDPKITKATLSPFRRQTWMTSRGELGIMLTIDFHPRSQQKVNAECAVNNGNCSLFCLPTSYGRKCACGKGISLQSDGITCVGVKLCDKSIPHGTLSSSCLARQDTSCTYSCESGRIVSYASVTCESTGSWKHPVSSWCKDSGSDVNFVLIGGAAGGAVVVIIIIIVIIIFVRRSRTPSQKNKIKKMETKVIHHEQNVQHFKGKGSGRPTSNPVGPLVFGASVTEEPYDEIKDIDLSYETLQRRNTTTPYDTSYPDPDDSKYTVPNTNISDGYALAYSKHSDHVNPRYIDRTPGNQNQNPFYRAGNDDPDRPYVDVLP